MPLSRTTHQNVDAVRTQNAHDDCSDGTEEETRVFEGHGHSQNTCSQRGLEQVSQGSECAANRSNALVEHGYVMSNWTPLDLRVGIGDLAVLERIVRVAVVAILQLSFIGQHGSGMEMCTINFIHKFET